MLAGLKTAETYRLGNKFHSRGRLSGFLYTNGHVRYRAGKFGYGNRIALADTYLQKGETQRAIELYESSLTGVFTENEHLLQQLIIAYNAVGWYDDIIPLAKKIYRSPQFPRSRAHLLYAIALDKTGQSEQAEKEFQTMTGRFGYYEQRYHYGLFLAREGRAQEATQLFNAIVEEGRHLSSQERSFNREWISRVKDELNRK